jgi:hypothetical protein
MPVYPGAHNPRRLHSTLGYRSPDEAERDYHQHVAVGASASAEDNAA